ncbi:MAG: hypothetical protein FJ096_10465 [Deltaproteobacteria bacterium]|nr:hypothetical protein [Deltaproteobacteria bacterium]
MKHRWVVGGLLLVPLLLGTLGFASDDPVPWPLGMAPSGPDLDEWIAAEEEIARRERFDEFLEAAEKGEDTEHMTVRQPDIDAGLFDLERLFVFGDAAFSHEFRNENGYGRLGLPRLSRVHDGRSGGLDSFSCAGCHQQGGVNGAGAVTANSFYFGDGERAASAIVRNPPNVLGLGLVQALAAEMTSDLQYRRTLATAKAVESGAPQVLTLEAHGVTFGTLVAKPDGTVDDSGVVGVDRDLRIKPFGWKGHTPTLRRFVERAALAHFGVQSHVLALGYQSNPEPWLGPGPNWWDPDNDGVQRELEEGTLTAYAIYLELLETPLALPPADEGLRERAAYGASLFASVGCADCHRPSLSMSSDRWFEVGDTTHMPGVEVRLLNDGEKPRGGLAVQLFSDLKRHHMGERLADPNDDPDGIGRDVFLTRPLWGLSESAPYLHDGRAATIAEAVFHHGGEAQEPRDLFLALSPEDQANVQLFLMSLSRMPRLRVPQ